MLCFRRSLRYNCGNWYKQSRLRRRRRKLRNQSFFSPTKKGNWKEKEKKKKRNFLEVFCMEGIERNDERCRDNAALWSFSPFLLTVGFFPLSFTPSTYLFIFRFLVLTKISSKTMRIHQRVIKNEDVGKRRIGQYLLDYHWLGDKVDCNNTFLSLNHSGRLQLHRQFW